MQGNAGIPGSYFPSLRDTMGDMREHTDRYIEVEAEFGSLAFRRVGDGVHVTAIEIATSPGSPSVLSLGVFEPDEIRLALDRL